MTHTCGTVNTISPNHKKKQNLFNRATHLRLNKDFHGSMRTYEKLLDEDQTDPEAHWGLTLSRYGIEYVKDRKTGEYHPTLHRMQKKSILLDIDYKDALTYARPGVRKKYEERAQRIDSIYKKYDAITKNEPSYDVFICYKETDDLTGKHTKDSVFAYEIVDYQFGYYEKNSFGIDITLQKTNSEETKILGIRNLENQSFEILGEGKFVVSA